MKNHRKPLKRNPPPARNENKMENNTSSLGITFMDGISLGTGSALGHRAIDIIFGTNKNIFSPSNRINDDYCKTLKGQLKECIELNDLPRNQEGSPSNNDFCKILKEKYEECLMNNTTQYRKL